MTGVVFSVIFSRCAQVANDNIENYRFLDLPLDRYPRSTYLTLPIITPQNANGLRTVSLTNQPSEAGWGGGK